MEEGETGKKAKTTPDTGAKSDRSDDIQERRDDNGGDDDEEDEDNEKDENPPLRKEYSSLIVPCVGGESSRASRDE